MVAKGVADIGTLAWRARNYYGFDCLLHQQLKGVGLEWKGLRNEQIAGLANRLNARLKFGALWPIAYFYPKSPLVFEMVHNLLHYVNRIVEMAGSSSEQYPGGIGDLSKLRILLVEADEHLLLLKEGIEARQAFDHDKEKADLELS